MLVMEFDRAGLARAAAMAATDGEQRRKASVTPSAALVPEVPDRSFAEGQAKVSIGS
jgi:hypothetical protein